MAGVDVILAHRLLKNRLVRGRAYLLLTEAALRWVGVDPTRAGLVAHTERYEHLGDVRCFVRDLDPVRGDATIRTLCASSLMASAPDAVAVGRH